MPYVDDPEVEGLRDDEEPKTSFKDDPLAECLADDEEPLTVNPSDNTFDQGIVVLARSEATDPAPPKSTGPSSATQTRPLSAWSAAQLEAEKLLSETTSRETLSCLVPDKAKTEAVVRDALAGKYKSDAKTAKAKSREAARVPLPALNLGMPKCGTESQAEFFLCAGYKASHSITNKDVSQGLCMRDATRNNLPVLATCTQDTDVLTQMDTHSAFGLKYKEWQFTSHELRDDCFLPQLSLLEEFHKDDPNVTFLLAFRPVKDWLDSQMNWGEGFGIKEVMECDLPNLPKGFPDVSLPKEDIVAVLEQFICSHVIRVRNFVQAHPSHALIEYDLYDKPTTSNVLGTLFPHVKTKTESSDCWQHVSHEGDLHQGDKIVASF